MYIYGCHLVIKIYYVRQLLILLIHIWQYNMNLKDMSTISQALVKKG